MIRSRGRRNVRYQVGYYVLNDVRSISIIVGGFEVWNRGFTYTTLLSAHVLNLT